MEQAGVAFQKQSLRWERISDGNKKTMDKGKSVDIIYRDCPEAFDKTPHETLLGNPASLGKM